MKYRIFCFLLLAIATIESCQDEQIVKPKLFLARIKIIVMDIGISGTLFDNYNRKLSRLSVENNRKPLEKAQIDSARRLFLDYMKEMDKGIRNLGSISEFDTTYKVVKANQSFFEHQRRFWNSLVPQMLILYDNGWENLSAEAKSKLTDVFKEMQVQQVVTQKLADSVKSVTTQFRKKYNLKPD